MTSHSDGGPSIRLSSSEFREIEAELAQPLFHGINLGPTLNDCLVIQFTDGQTDWHVRTTWMNQARKLRHWLLPQRWHVPSVVLPSDHILMTWQTSTPRLDELLTPVLDELRSTECAVLYSKPNVTSQVPLGVPTFGWEQAIHCEMAAWRSEYERCRPEWTRRLRDVCTRLHLPRGAFETLSLQLMVASQRVAGSLQLLQRGRPSVILTEYDRNHLWSCLVLAARRLGIPTVTLVHGVMGRDAVGFAPVLADKVLCWGELDRRKLVAAGVAPDRAVVAGCPRLTRDLPATQGQARRKLGLDIGKPVVMFATSPERLCFQQVEPFCAAIEGIGMVSGVVRLHPSERLPKYARIAQRHPAIRFTVNSDATLNESLAASDVVVVRDSGVGSDALLKRRPVVVFDSEECLTGHNRDLVHLAGCPHARTESDLAETLRCLVSEPAFREGAARNVERYVADFCDAFGEESARRIADVVRQAAKASPNRILTKSESLGGRVPTA